MSEHNGTIKIGNKNYKVAVIDGVRCIDGKTVDEFLETLSIQDVAKFVKIGAMAIKDEMQGVKPPKGKYQYYINN